jgi:hypothetical protein
VLSAVEQSQKNTVTTPEVPRAVSLIESGGRMGVRVGGGESECGPSFPVGGENIVEVDGRW